jgi:hypothetical protein
VRQCIALVQYCPHLAVGDHVLRSAGVELWLLLGVGPGEVAGDLHQIMQAKKLNNAVPPGQLTCSTHLALRQVRSGAVAGQLPRLQLLLRPHILHRNLGLFSYIGLGS